VQWSLLNVEDCVHRRRAAHAGRRSGPAEGICRTQAHRGVTGHARATCRRSGKIRRFLRLKQAALDVIADRLRTPHEVELDRAQDLFSEAKERVAAQRERVTEQMRLGQNSELSQQLLGSFELTLRLMLRHTQVIENEVKREEAASDPR